MATRRNKELSPTLLCQLESSEKQTAREAKKIEAKSKKQSRMRLDVPEKYRGTPVMNRGLESRIVREGLRPTVPV